MPSAAKRPAKKKPSESNWWWIHLAVLGGGYLIAGGLIAAVLLGLPGLPSFLRPKPKVVEKIVRLPPEPPPLPPKFVPRKEANVAQLFNGITYKTTFESLQGGRAARERKSTDSYAVDIAVRVRVPSPNQTLEELASLNPELPAVLPGLPTLLQSARASDFYFALYDRKVAAVKSDLQALNRLLSRHNFYDCETILELQHPITRRKALLVQAEMDVVADGSDPERTFKVVGTYTHFQPMTSYRWPRRTKVRNPLIALYESRIAKYEAEIRQGASKSRVDTLKSAINDAKAHIQDMKNSSSLVALADPFIVMPTFMVTRTGHAFKPAIGDFAVVVHKNTIYPAIVGDAGPNTKVGEASLRLAQTINPKATPYQRPIDDLVITYIVFPGTGGPRSSWGPPNLELWRKRCTELLNEIGGYGGTIHQWEDLLAPPALEASTAGTASATGNGAISQPEAENAPTGSGTSSPATSGSN